MKMSSRCSKFKKKPLPRYFTKHMSSPSFRKSLGQAIQGLKLAYKTEKSFRIQVMATICLLIILFILPLFTWERVLLLLVAMIVLVLELLNSSVERLVDLIKPQLQQHAGEIKDVMAGAVLLASLFSLIFASVILIPHLIAIFNRV